MSEENKDPKNIFEKLFGQEPESGYIFRGLQFSLGHRAVVISWSCQGIGFGELALIFSEAGMDMDTECMGNDFVVAALDETIKRIENGQKAVTYDFTDDGDMVHKETLDRNEDFIKSICQTFKFYILNNKPADEAKN